MRGNERIHHLRQPPARRTAQSILNDYQAGSHRGIILPGHIEPIVPGRARINTTRELQRSNDITRRHLCDNLVPGDEPQATADRILRRFRKGTDDALVLVVRCLGDES